MAVLRVLKGSCPGQLLELHGDRLILGRHPNCQIVLDNAAVSRHHAQILESHGTYYVEDLRSRNGTLVNGQRIAGRTELREGDRVRVCEVVFSFHLGMPPAGQAVDADEVETGLAPASDSSSGSVHATVMDKATDESPVIPQWATESEDRSAIVSTLDVQSGSRLRLGVKPEAKLRAILEISENLGRTLNLNQMLPKILDSLFKIFPQADRGFLMLKNPQSNELETRAVRVRYDDQSDSVPLSRTIVNEALKTGRAILSADAEHDQRFKTSESISNFKIRSMLCAPLMSQFGEGLGVLQLDTQDLRRQFSQDDLDVLVSVAFQAAMAVENAALHEEVLKRRELDRDLEFATQVQLGFLPTEQPIVPGYEFFDHYEAAQQVGGDFFDYVALPGGRLAVCVGDVAGKGVPAALLMARMYSAARSHLSEKSPGEALSALNAGLASSGLGFRFITFVVALLDPHTHQAIIANAGHLPPVVRKRGGEVQKIGMEASGLPLGVKQDTKYEQITLSLDPGDVVVLYTDGLTEAMNGQNEIYGLKRLTAFLNQSPDLNLADLGRHLIEDVESFCEDRPQRDDTCVIGFHRLTE